MEEWLKTFAFRTELNAFPFIITAIGSVLIALITVGLKTSMVAQVNPVETLRSE